MNLGWTAVSKSDQIRGGPPTTAPITCKKHLLRIRAAGGIIFTTQEDAELAERAFNDLAIMKPGRATFGRDAYFGCRLHKHWLYKPTRREKNYFDHQVIEGIMDV
jgi:hypothetical protein